MHYSFWTTVDILSQKTKNISSNSHLRRWKHWIWKTVITNNNFLLMNISVPWLTLQCRRLKLRFQNSIMLLFYDIKNPSKLPPNLFFNVNYSYLTNYEVMTSWRRNTTYTSSRRCSEIFSHSIQCGPVMSWLSVRTPSCQFHSLNSIKDNDWINPKERRMQNNSFAIAAFSLLVTTILNLSNLQSSKSTET